MVDIMKLSRPNLQLNHIDLAINYRFYTFYVYMCVYIYVYLYNEEIMFVEAYKVELFVYMYVCCLLCKAFVNNIYYL